MTKTKACRVCGKLFTVSRTDSTVHCPEHRRRSKATAEVPVTVPVCRCGKTVLFPGVTCPRECQ